MFSVIFPGSSDPSGAGPAFLERSRLELLEAYLFNDAVGKFVDQALIILPLGKSRDEESAQFKVEPFHS